MTERNLNDPRIKDAVEQLRIFHGLPPHNTWSNICYADGYFLKAWEQKFPKWIQEEAHKKIKEEL